MSKYSFVIRKGVFELELSTTDRELLSAQFELWMNRLTNYVKKKKGEECKRLVKEQIEAESLQNQKKVEKHLEKLKTHTVMDNIASVDKQDIVSEATDNVPSDLDVIYTKTPQVNQSITEIASKSDSGVFDEILEKSLKNPQAELSFKSSPTIKKDSAFLSYITSRKIDKKLDYLLLTAYYFTQYEQIPRFTLKQLNAKLMQNIAVIIDHSVLQEAINRDYIECLPDLTGLVGASEYRLTAYGEKVLLDE